MVYKNGKQDAFGQFNLYIIKMVIAKDYKKAVNGIQNQQNKECDGQFNLGVCMKMVMALQWIKQKLLNGIQKQQNKDMRCN